MRGKIRHRQQGVAKGERGRFVKGKGVEGGGKGWLAKADDLLSERKLRNMRSVNRRDRTVALLSLLAL
jgi:hypothetical protein